MLSTGTFGAVYDFGNRRPVTAGVVNSGQISGSGGSLQITTPGAIYGPAGITLSDAGITSATAMSISNQETWNMEANAIQIGGANSGQLDLLTHDGIFTTVLTVYSRDGSVATTYRYLIRYFENPLYSYGLGG